jgi:tRNA pseudouridine55 synthase
MEGLFLINKPTGISSREAGDVVKDKLSLTKIGHVGTLDLEASGLLLLLSGRATRLQNYFLESNKVYEGEIILGKKSSTDDIFGEIQEIDGYQEILSTINKEQFINEIINNFSPSYMQIPPHVSAKKRDGEKSYNLAKKGILLELDPKEVQNNFIKIEFTSDELLKYKIEVSSGFYVRSLARDIGKLKEVGGVTKSIERTSVGKFQLSHAIKLEDLLSEKVTLKNISMGSFYPLREIFSFLNYPEIIISDPIVRSNFLNGNVAALDQLIKENTSLIKSKNGVCNVVFKDSKFDPLGIVSIRNESAKYDFVLPNS